MRKNLLSLFTTALATLTLLLWGNVGLGQYSGTGTFEKITELTELESGGYYIFYGINDTNEGAMDNTGTSRMGATSVDINVDGKIVDPLAKIVWRVDGNSTHGYTLYSEDSGEYCEITANSTSGFSQSTTSTHEYEVSVSAGDWLFMSNHANAGGRCISIYQTDFRPYTASDTKPLHLYKMPVGLDTTPPVPTFAPADAATDVPINVNPTITFDEPIYTSPGGVLVDNTNVADLITLTNGTDPVAFTATIAENVITVTPAADLAYETAHTLTVAAVQDEAGNAMAADASATFTTETADTEPPIPTFAPADATTDVAIDVNPTITFDEPIYTSPAGVVVDNSNVTDLITFTDGVDPVAFTATIAGNAITVTPTAELLNEQAYTLAIAIVEDEAGNAMAAPESATFTTISETSSGGGLEDFTNSTATTSYTDGSFVGNDGITWTYVASRDDNGDANGSGINLPALMLRRVADNSSVTSSAISGGIGNFSVKLYKGFTGGGDRQVELFINGVSQGTSTPFDDFDEHLFGVNDINIKGNIVISIKNTTSRQVIIDDITWTGYIDTDPPVPTFSPVDAAIDVPINVNPTITFDEPIYTSPAGVVVDNTNVADLITLTDGTNPVAFTATIAENVITVTPAADLAYETAHTLTVAPVQDETGNVATSESITFTTMALTAQTIELTGTYDGPYYAGEAITVTWNAANFNNVKVEVWNPTTSAWGVMVTSTPAVDGTATFTIPAGAEYSADYKLRIADAEDGNPFDESGTFKVREVHSSLSTLRVRPPDTEARFDGSAVVTYSRTTRNQKYIQDNDAAILIDDNTSVITQEYPVGSEITGLIGKISIYNAVVQFIPLENPGVPASTGNAVVPFVTTLADLTSADQSKLVRLENITFISTGTFASGQDYIIHDNIETPGVFRTNFSESDYISQSIPNQNITEMLALVSEFNGILQVTSRSTHDWTILSSDATLAALTLGGESVLGHAGLEVTNPAVDEGATLFVVDFTDFKGIVANAADANASVEVRLNGTVVETVNLATQALADGDVVVVTVTAEDNTTIAHYKVTLTGENRELTLTAPVGVNNYTTGDDIVLTWTSANIDNVNLYAVDAQANLINENPIVASLGTYTYTVANGDFGTFHFRIADALDNTFYDETSEASTISDTQAPDAIATYPLLGEVDMPISFTLRIDFDEIVQLGMGNLTIHKNVDNTIVQTLTETDGTVDGNVFTVDITGLDWGTDYYINIAAGLIKDLSGNQFPAITDQSWTFTTKQPVIDLFFSEYIEGSSNNKALEIYNPTGAPVDLSAYQVKQFTNGSNVVNSTESLTGILAAGGVYVIANTSAVSEITDMADITSGVTFYNGNDAVGLYKNDVLIDIIGTKLLPVSGGSGFPDFNVAGVTGATKDHTLVRKNSVLFGNTDWAKSAGTSPEDSEWIVHEVDNFSFLGWHIEPPTHTVTFSVVNGTGGLLTAKVDDIEIYSPADVEAGKNIAFTATPEAGYQVKAWTLNGAIVDGNTSTTYTLDNLAAAANVTVEFEAIPATTFAVTYSVVGTNGSIAATVDGTAITSGDEVEVGKDVLFTATPEAGYQVKAWTLNGAIVDGNTSTTYTLDNLAAATNVTVEFEAIPATTFAVTYSVVGTNGSIAATVDGTAIETGAMVEAGKNIVFTATPEAGYQVKAWTLNAAPVAGNTTTTYTVETLAEATDVTVEFETIPATTYAVTFSVVGTNGAIAATVDGTAIETGAMVEAGKNIAFTATPEAGYQVKAWTLNAAPVAGNTTTAYTVEVLAEATDVTVEFEAIPPTTYTVTYSVVGTNGAIAATVDGTAIETGAMVEAGKNIVFTATPEAGYQVKAWTLNAAPVAGNTTTTYTVETLAEATDVTVEFETIPATTYAVTFSVVGTNGAIAATVDGTAIETGAMVEAGKNIAFTATPEAGYQVKAWTLNGAIVDGNTSTTYTLDNLAAAANVTVEFETIPATTYAVTFSVVGTNGAIAATVDGTAIETGAMVEAGKNIAFTATPEAGYQVKAWTLNAAPVAGNTTTAYTVEVLAEATDVTVEFEAIPPTTYTVTYSVVGTNGAIAATVDGTAIETGAMVEAGKNIVFTATPEAGYQVKAWTLNAAPVAGNTTTTYTVETLAEATDVTVEFETIPATTYAVTFSVVGTNGAIAATVDGTAIETGAMVEAGKNIAFTATPEAGYQVKAWTLNGAIVDGNTSTTYTLDNLAAAANVTVEFETIPATTYAVTFSVVGTNGAIAATVDGTAIETGAMVEAGKNIAFTATPEAGYQVKAWTLNAAPVAGNTTTAYTVEVLAEATDVTVEFEAIPPTTYTVTFSVVGTNGAIAATVDGTAIETGAEVEEGKNIVFTATPEAGYQVKAWTLNAAPVAGNTTTTYTVAALAEATDVTVEFETIPATTYAVTFSVVGTNGAIAATVDGTAIETGAMVEAGKNIVFTATPEAGYQVKAWTLNAAPVAGNTTTTYTVETLAEATDVTVEFETIPATTYAVTFSVVGTNGAIAATVDGTAIETGAMVEAGKNIAFTATPEAGYQVKAWTLNGAIVDGNTSTTYTLDNLAAAANVTVEFEAIPPTTYAVTYSVVGTNGTIAATVDGAAITSGDEVEVGKDVLFTATPEAGYQVKAWTLNGTPVEGTTTYTITDLQAAATVTVEFEAIPPTTYAVTFSVVGENGTIAATVDGAAIESGAEVEAGSEVVFTATPAEGYEVKEWTLDGTVVEDNTTVTYTITDLQAASEVTVEFKVFVGIETNSLSNFKAYPNPFTNTIWIENVENASRIVIFNLIGQQVINVDLTNTNRTEINTDNFLSGVYFVTIINNQGQKTVRKMIKR